MWRVVVKLTNVTRAARDSISRIAMSPISTYIRMLSARAMLIVNHAGPLISAPLAWILSVVFPPAYLTATCFCISLSLMGYRIAVCGLLRPSPSNTVNASTVCLLPLGLSPWRRHSLLRGRRTTSIDLPRFVFPFSRCCVCRYSLYHRRVKEVRFPRFSLTIFLRVSA